MRCLPPEEADGGCELPRHPAGGEGAGVRKARVGLRFEGVFSRGS